MVGKVTITIYLTYDPANSKQETIIWERSISITDEVIAAAAKSSPELGTVLQDLKDGKYVDTARLNESMATAFHLNNTYIFQILVDKGADINTKFNYQRPLLYNAASKKDIKGIKLLLKYPNLNINAQDEDNNTALHEAIHSGKDSIEIVRLLLNDPKININVKNKGGDTPLHVAVVNGDQEKVKLLLEYLQRKNLLQQALQAENNNFRTPLTIPSFNGEIKTLLQQYAQH